MSGKGSKPRPFDVDKKTYESNWDRIFSKKESDNPLEGGFWDHACTMNGQHYVARGEECSWCGEREDD
jgi:hypothetical protein